MSGQPPPYEEIAAENPALLEPDTALVVHLQVWHCRREGRSPENNDRLAALFRNHNQQQWNVVPFVADGVTGQACHDLYVPVEVSTSIPLTTVQLSTYSPVTILRAD